MRTLLLLTLFSALFLVTLAQPGSGPTPIDVNYLGTAVEWVPLVPVEGCVLTITGPDRFQLKQAFAADARPLFTVGDERGLVRADGSYRWELVLRLPHSAGVANPVVSGRFGVSAGSVVPGPDSELLAAPGDPAVAFSVEGPSNNFFGTGAGVSTTTGVSNSFFGGYAGQNTTTGSYNSIFGRSAGQGNTTGGGNSYFGANAGETGNGEADSFFGDSAGRLNTGSYGAFFGQGAGFSNQSNGNSFFGYRAGFVNTTGSADAFFGNQAGYANTTGSHNSFFGSDAGNANTTGPYNSFFGTLAGAANTTARQNAFFGESAGAANTDGSYNSFFGQAAGRFNTVGAENCFFGQATGYFNTASNNSFFGASAGGDNGTGTGNSFFGQAAGRANTTASENSFFGREAGHDNTTGARNSAIGGRAGISNTVENDNTFVGYRADLNPGANPAVSPVTNATAIGFRSYVAQSNSLVLGSILGVNDGPAYVNVGIGTPAPVRQLHLAGPNAVFRMDRSTDTAAFIMVRTDSYGTPMKTFVVGTNAWATNQGEFIINDVGTAVGGLGNRRMTITNAGNVEFTGVVTAADFASPSSIALKTNVRTLDHAVATVNRLRGVRFDWKNSGMSSLGLIAEEVEKVLPEVVAHEDGQATGVNYAKLVPLLLEAVKEQQATIQRQQQTIEHQGARLEALERLLDQREP